MSNEILTNTFNKCTKCGFDGFAFEDSGISLCKFSADGYCLKCEMEVFSKNSRPCPFCRRSLKGEEFCNDCSLSKIIGYNNVDLFNKNTSLFIKINNWEANLYKSTLPGTCIDSCVELNPGFYMGSGVWKKLNYIPIMTENAIALEIRDPAFISMHNFTNN